MLRAADENRKSSAAIPLVFRMNHLYSIFSVMMTSYQTQQQRNLYNQKIRLAGLLKLCFVMISTGLGIALPAHAQHSLGARMAALGHAGSALGDGAWNVFANPALLSAETGTISFYGIRNYGMSELTDMAASGSYSPGGRVGTFALGMHSYGFELYRESRFRLGYQNSYAGLKLGVVPGITHLSIRNYGSATAFTLDAGLAYALVEDVLYFGAWASNLNRARLGESREELPRALAAGLSYRIARRALLTGEVFKDVRFPVSWRGGLEVELIDQLFVRGGLTTEPLTYALGAGYRTGRLSFNFAAQQHYALGWSPGLDIGLRW